jgi:Fe-S-cluster containining protein
MEHGKEPFYTSGLQFSCTRCSSCCRYESGYVFLNKKDVMRLAAECQMKYTDFVCTYCRWIPWSWGEGERLERLSLKEKTNFDCIFWKNGCTVYAARPLQCVTFPFWEDILSSSASWALARTGCPGMDRGKCYSGEEIQSILNRQAEPAVLRRAVSRGEAGC